jgi:hypothetical protein
VDRVAQCPKCHSKSLRLSRTRSRWERWRKEITSKRPYRCRACQWRGWLSVSIDIEQTMDTPPMVADPPNLRGTLLARSETRHKLDLKDLDQFHKPPQKDDA